MHHKPLLRRINSHPHPPRAPPLSCGIPCGGSEDALPSEHTASPTQSLFTNQPPNTTPATNQTEPSPREAPQISTSNRSHRIASHRIASHPIPSHPIPSHPIPSHRIASHRIASHRIASRPETAPTAQRPPSLCPLHLPRLVMLSVAPTTSPCSSVGGTPSREHPSQGIDPVASNRGGGAGARALKMSCVCWGNGGGRVLLERCGVGFIGTSPCVMKNAASKDGSAVHT